MKLAPLRDEEPTPGSQGRWGTETRPSLPTAELSALVWPRRMAWVMGALAASVGVVVIFGWFMHSQWLVQVRPNSPAMQFNTALSFVATGAALMLLARARVGWASFLGAGVAAFAGLTLSQYLFRANLGVDTALFMPWTSARTSHLGRMSPLTALCFVVTGLGFVLAAIRQAERRHPLWLGLPGAWVGVLGLLVLLGY